MTTSESVQALIDKLRKVGTCIYIAVEKSVADDVSQTCYAAADALSALGSSASPSQAIREALLWSENHVAAMHAAKIASWHVLRAEMIRDRLIEALSALGSSASPSSPSASEGREAELLALIAEGENDRAGLCTQFDGCWHCRVLACLKALSTAGPVPSSELERLVKEYQEAAD